MKNVRLFALIAFVLLLLAGYMGRGRARDWWEVRNRPTLPAAEPFRPATESADGAVDTVASPFEPGYSTSQHYVLETVPAAKPKRKDPLAFTGTLPSSVNLDVPFMTQAPKSNWDMPYQEACEEASSLMVDQFYRGKTGRIDSDTADRMILRLVEYEKRTLGHYEDTTAAEMKTFIEGYFGYADVRVVPFDSIDDVKKVLASGYPVLIPASGKLLHNPNYKNGGPLYHVLVVRGYTPEALITNDPGTRKGEEYTYSYDTVLNAAHDWNGGDVVNGKRVMVVILPST